VLNERAHAKTVRCPCAPRTILDSSSAPRRSANVSRSLSFFVDSIGKWDTSRIASQAKEGLRLYPAAWLSLSVSRAAGRAFGPQT
jgi:hypothetical protein